MYCRRSISCCYSKCNYICLNGVPSIDLIWIWIHFTFHISVGMTKKKCRKCPKIGSVPGITLCKMKKKKMVDRKQTLTEYEQLLKKKNLVLNLNMIDTKWAVISGYVCSRSYAYQSDLLQFYACSFYFSTDVPFFLPVGDIVPSSVFISKLIGKISYSNLITCL